MCSRLPFGRTLHWAVVVRATPDPYLDGLNMRVLSLWSGVVRVLTAVFCAVT